MLLLTNINHILHAWETLAHKVSALACFKLRQHLIGHIHVVTVPCAVYDAQSVHI